MPTTLEAPTIRIATTRFGRIEVDPGIVITFPDGLIGFESCRRFAIVNPEGSNPIRWLQSLEDGALAFPVIDPWLAATNYAPTIAAEDYEDLDMAANDPQLILAIVTIPRSNPRDMTANLLAPVLINPIARQAKQIIALDEQYTTRHALLPQTAACATMRAA